MAEALFPTTTTGGFKGPDTHQQAAATEARGIRWYATKRWRWNVLADSSRAKSSQSVVITDLVAIGHHDVSAVIALPEKLVGVFYDTITFTRVMTLGKSFWGPSFLGDPTENATIQEVEDQLFSGEFVNAFRVTLGQLTQLALLEYDWDSYEAPPIEEAARLHAIQLLSYLHKTRRSVPAPIVGPSPSGSVVLQWFRPDLEVHVDVGSETCEYYIAHPDEGEVRHHAKVNVRQLSEVATTLATVLT